MANRVDRVVLACLLLFAIIAITDPGIKAQLFSVFDLGERMQVSNK